MSYQSREVPQQVWVPAWLGRCCVPAAGQMTWCTGRTQWWDLTAEAVLLSDLIIRFVDNCQSVATIVTFNMSPVTILHWHVLVLSCCCHPCSAGPPHPQLHQCCANRRNSRISSAGFRPNGLVPVVPLVEQCAFGGCTAQYNQRPEACWMLGTCCAPDPIPDLSGMLPQYSLDDIGIKFAARSCSNNC